MDTHQVGEIIIVGLAAWNLARERLRERRERRVVLIRQSLELRKRCTPLPLIVRRRNSVMGDGGYVHLWDPDDEKVVTVSFPT